MAYDKRLESVRGAKAVYDENQKAAATDRLKKVAAKLKAKRLAKKVVEA